MNEIIMSKSEYEAYMKESRCSNCDADLYKNKTQDGKCKCCKGCKYSKGRTYFNCCDDCWDGFKDNYTPACD